MNQPLLAITACALLSSTAHAADPVYNLQATLANEDFGSGRDDQYLQLTGSVKALTGLSRNSVINLGADLFTRSYQDLDARDSNGLLIEAFYHYVPTGGFRKPTYLLGLRHEIERFDDDTRDSGETSLIAALSLRLDDRITITPGLEFRRTSTDLVDTDLGGVFFNSDIRLTEQSLVYLNLKFQDEDIDAADTTAAARPAPSLIGGGHLPGEPGYAPPVTDTPSPTDSATDTGSSSTGSSNSTFSIGFNHAIDNHHSVDVSYEYIDYALDGADDVSGRTLSFDYFYKF